MATETVIHPSGQASPTPYHERSSEEQLRDSLHEIDSFCQNSLGKIEAIGKAAMRGYEQTWAHRTPETMLVLFETIVDIAFDLRNLVNCEAGRHGADYVDERSRRVYAAESEARQLDGGR
jgi:hypothetical protein